MRLKRQQVLYTKHTRLRSFIRNTCAEKGSRRPATAAQHLCVCVNVCMYVYIFINTHIYIHTRTHTAGDLLQQRSNCVCVYAYTHTHTHTHTHTQTHTAGDLLLQRSNSPSNCLRRPLLTRHLPVLRLYQGSIKALLRCY
jgi:hypothetical protein